MLYLIGFIWGFIAGFILTKDILRERKYKIKKYR